MKVNIVNNQTKLHLFRYLRAAFLRFVIIRKMQIWNFNIFSSRLEKYIHAHFDHFRVMSPDFSGSDTSF